MDEAELLAGCSDGDPLMAFLLSSSRLSVAQTFGVCVCIHTHVRVCSLVCVCVRSVCSSDVGGMRVYIHTHMCVYVVSFVCVSGLPVAQTFGYVCVRAPFCVCLNIVS